VTEPPPLDLAWREASLSAREEEVLLLRLDHTLRAIGEELTISPERVRQIERAAKERLGHALRAAAPTEVASLGELLGQQAAVAEADIELCLHASSRQRLPVALSALGIAPPRTWAGILAGWWARDLIALDRMLRDLAAKAPFPDNELPPLARAVGLPTGLPLIPIMDHPASPITRHRAGPWWVRRRAVHRDAAYLWLASHGKPTECSEIAAHLGIEDHPMRENMRRDDRFVQLRPAGTWALSEWHLPANDGFRSALDAVISILRERGPLHYTELLREMRERYPVTKWRVDQCLTSDRVGRMPDGRLGLVADGAILVEETEPPRPANVAVSADGQLIAIRMRVDHDLLRGSGLPVPRFAAWRSGLRHAPDSRSFAMEGSSERISIRKGTSMTQVTALRRFAAPLGVTEGCTLALLLRLDTGTARLVHGCAPGQCPSGGADGSNSTNGQRNKAN